MLINPFGPHAGIVHGCVGARRVGPGPRLLVVWLAWLAASGSPGSEAGGGNGGGSNATGGSGGNRPGAAPGAGMSGAGGSGAGMSGTGGSGAEMSGAGESHAIGPPGVAPPSSAASAPAIGVAPPSSAASAPAIGVAAGLSGPKRSSGSSSCSQTFCYKLNNILNIRILSGSTS